MPLFLRALAIVIIACAFESLLVKRDPVMAAASTAIAIAPLNSARIHELEDKLNQG